jgi:group I intron endonuclease
MFYTVYKIINKVNNKFYIGVHATKNMDDSYMGSGKLIKKAIAKYGIDNFQKEILFVFDNESEMLEKEKELVVLSEMSYNLCEGGKGGFGYINRSSIPKFKNRTHSDESKEKIASSMKGNKNSYGRRHSEEAKKAIGENTRKKLTGSKKSEEHKRKISEAIKKKHREK